MRRRDFMRAMGSVTLVGGFALAPWDKVQAQRPSGVLRVLSEGVPNTFDPQGSGINREASGLFWNVYERLLGFDTRPHEGGGRIYDYFKQTGRLAESWEESRDGRQITLKLRTGTRFHDGSPVTADDVKWSLDRALVMPVTKSLFAIGSMTSPAQFSVIDERTVRISLPQKNRFTLPLLGINYTAIYNAKVARAHATSSDPWAAEWLKTNTAAGGPYRVASFTPGQQISYERFDAWSVGLPRPHYQRVVHQLSPAPSSRIAALVRGDADIATTLPPKEMSNLANQAGVKVLSIPMSNLFHCIAMSSNHAPFGNVKVRQAIAYALPYNDMFQAALFRRGRLLTGNREGVQPLQFPSGQPYSTDVEKAKQLLSEAGFGKGFSTTFSFNIADALIAEPIALLVKESLGRLGIDIVINKVPNSQWGQLTTEKKVPFFFEQSAAWLSDPDYGYRVFYTGPQSRWNFGTFDDPALESLLDQAKFEADKRRYEDLVRKMHKIVAEQVPMIMLWQPAMDTAMRAAIEGYTYYFHRQPEYATLTQRV